VFQNHNMKLHIGCGKEILDDWINIDKYPMSSQVQQVDITTFPLPFKDNQFEYIRMRNILEHLPIESQLKLFDELHRITKREGLIWIRVPYGSHWTRRIDHYRGYTYSTFKHIDSYWFGKGKRFKIHSWSDHPTKLGRLLVSKYIRRFFDYIASAELFITDIIIELEVIKEK